MDSQNGGNKYEAIDREATRIILSAEEHCVPRYRYSSPWSVKLIPASRIIKY